MPDFRTTSTQTDEPVYGDSFSTTGNLSVASVTATGTLTTENLVVDSVDVPTGATAVAAAEDSNNVDVVVTLLDADDAAIGNVATVQWWISDDSGGDGVCATAPTTVGITPAGAGSIHQLVAGKGGWLTTNASGVCNVRVTDSGSDTWYLVIVLPTGQRVVSNAITVA